MQREQTNIDIRSPMLQSSACVLGVASPLETDAVGNTVVGIAKATGGTKSIAITVLSCLAAGAILARLWREVAHPASWRGVLLAILADAQQFLFALRSHAANM